MCMRGKRSSVTVAQPNTLSEFGTEAATRLHLSALLTHRHAGTAPPLVASKTYCAGHAAVQFALTDSLIR